MGLTITKRLTEMLGGTIELQSELGKGTTFIFRFPEVEVGQASCLSASEDLEQFQKATLLVVDDVESNRDLIGEYFQGTKHTLLMAADGLEAIRMAEEYHPDVILLDLRMPNMNGKEAAEYLKKKEETKDIPIIILTASALQEDWENMQPFCSAFLYKPVTKTQLIGELKNFLSLDELEDFKLEVSEDENHGFKEEDKSRWPELLEKLLEKEKTSWPALCKTMKMRDLQQFAEELQQWGREYACPLLLDYAKILSLQIEEFDWENLPQTMASFPEVKLKMANG